MAERPPYPLTAIVGQERMKRGLILNAISSGVGGVLIRGERGTAKSTAARGLAALLPEIAVVAGCPFSCDPTGVEGMCDVCRERALAGEALPVAHRRARFVDLPVSATEDRVVGTLDIERAIQHGLRRFEPGVLAAANRGLLYVDEVNLLDDHVVDLLLDSAAMGVNVVEREGISFSHPARFILVGTMNPEEGDLRPQLLDRFALCVEIHSILDVEQRVNVVERCVAYERDPEDFYEAWAPREEGLSREIAAARSRLPGTTYTRNDLLAIAQLTTAFKVDGHRADIVTLKAALALAAWAGRSAIAREDILQAAELALPHRVKRQSLEQAVLQPGEIEDRLRSTRPLPGPGHELPGDGRSGETPANRSTQPLAGTTAEPAGGRPMDKDAPQGSDDSGKIDWLRAVAIGRHFKAKRLATPPDRLARNAAGKRSLTRTERKRGRYVRARQMEGPADDVAFDATLRAAAPFQRERHGEKVQAGETPEEGPRPALLVRRQDLRRKIRVRRASNLILFVVDASWSMSAAERIEATKGAVLSLLQDAYQRRDHVGMIVFQGTEATVVLRPTSSVGLARRVLKDIAAGGKTPLSAGLWAAYQVCIAARRRDPEVVPLIIILTDGAGNISMGWLPPQDEAWHVADLIHQAHLRSVVVNMEHPAHDQGLPERLALALGGLCRNMTQLGADALLRIVRDDQARAGISLTG